ncbi:PREDICTED: 28S ribosomal protein S36, mitochondrial-like isoform X2 [Priapulus caudatus]|uniref:28S ribosomal protein S36, mitochondrial-like isoform X2 n=1 Tax=Priapulus caudatus TaxID=37621 RepID=A0ABM1F9G5_PRICU|nr:PREDICTED: 28S ribosomal protein S36, mitochondrial-like isoform X2 [Priapulus caudatus]
MATPIKISQVIRQHIPLIKFRYGVGKKSHGLNRASDTPAPQQASALAAPLQAAVTTPSTLDPVGPAIGNTMRGSGIPFVDLPVRFQRKPISEEELEYINGRGDPN